MLVYCDGSARRFGMKRSTYLCISYGLTDKVHCILTACGVGCRH